MPEIEFVTITPEATHNFVIKPDETQGVDLHVVKEVETNMRVVTSEQSAIDNSKLIDVVVNDLVLSELNPRQIVSADEIEILAQSVRSVGCIQNLIGLEVDGKIEIVAGGRRLRALQKIIAEDNTPQRTEKVRITRNKNEALAMAGTLKDHNSIPQEIIKQFIAANQIFDLKGLASELATVVNT